MNFSRLIIGLGLVAALSACAAPQVTRSTTGLTGNITTGSAVRFTPGQFRVVDVNVTVPQTLTVSEENRYFPRADIVWRGDPVGNRYQQVGAILNDAMRRGTADFNGPQDIVLDIELARFHGVTERARYSIGGTHDVDFFLTVRDARSGAVLQPRRLVDSNLRALGGDEAVAADMRGETQKVRVTQHLAKVIHGELTGIGIPEVVAALNGR